MEDETPFLLSNIKAEPMENETSLLSNIKVEPMENETPLLSNIKAEPDEEADNLQEEVDAVPPNSLLASMKRADLISELQNARHKIIILMRRKDEMKAAYVRVAQLAKGKAERDLEAYRHKYRELRSERDSLLQQLQEEVGKNEAMRQTICEASQSQMAIVNSIKEDNAAKVTDLENVNAQLIIQRDDLRAEMLNLDDKLKSIYEENQCSICLSGWEAQGDHRPVSLKCGHLFGENCIRQQVTRGTRDCPICKKPAMESDVRKIFGCQTLLGIGPSQNVTSGTSALPRAAYFVQSSAQSPTSAQGASSEGAVAPPPHSVAPARPAQTLHGTGPSRNVTSGTSALPRTAYLAQSSTSAQAAASRRAPTSAQAASSGSILGVRPSEGRFRLALRFGSLDDIPAPSPNVAGAVRRL